MLSTFIRQTRPERVIPVPQLQPLLARNIKRGPFFDKMAGCSRCCLFEEDHWKQINLEYCMRHNLPTRLPRRCPVCDDVPDMIVFSDDE
jgi:hypothetical protein